MMFAAALAVLMASNATISEVKAAELTVLAPGFAANAGIKDLAASYEKETGVKVMVKSVGMGAMMDTIKTGTPSADIVILPKNLIPAGVTRPASQVSSMRRRPISASAMRTPSRPAR